ncbi:DUF1788 domain-containing protein [Aliarcobacter butzleri]|uniref:DUF1788 domain-containing protein n=1 Tax=Aliarcobacter butzleri TaxID=28197 RepID=UPI00263E0496|nr:DUF1788 domain-containing protein [Aliarcobacter butzleri]MDN5081973.1 DUF1788 domain-containing protein [Aliarcobacter butzleri]MDN5084283.1 DUF1788 domain-containing protein [Aliarcobacter butzleri]
MKQERLEDKFEKLYQTFINSNFLSMDSIGGEIPFYISSYNPAQEVNVFSEIERLINRLKINGIAVFEVNLFSLVMEMLKDRGILDKLIEKEPNLSKDKLYKTIQGAIDTQKYLIPKIEKLVSNNPSKIFFLTGIGQVYSFLRSHTVLNNLQNAVRDRPTVMFFPGVYDGTSLSLFGKLKDDNYYRAFNLETINLIK